MAGKGEVVAEEGEGLGFFFSGLIFSSLALIGVAFDFAAVGFGDGVIDRQTKASWAGDAWVSAFVTGIYDNYNLPKASLKRMSACRGPRYRYYTCF